MANPKRDGACAGADVTGAVLTGEASLLIYPYGLLAAGRSWHLSRDDLAAGFAATSELDDSGRTLNVMVAGASSGRSLHPSG